MLSCKWRKIEAEYERQRKVDVSQRTRWPNADDHRQTRVLPQPAGPRNISLAHGACRRIQSMTRVGVESRMPSHEEMKRMQFARCFHNA